MSSAKSVDNGLIPFTLEEPEFDTKTYMGRFWSFFKTCDPVHAFHSNTTINKMRDAIASQRKREEE